MLMLKLTLAMELFVLGAPLMFTRSSNCRVIGWTYCHTLKKLQIVLEWYSSLYSTFSFCTYFRNFDCGAVVSCFRARNTAGIKDLVSFVAIALPLGFLVRTQFHSCQITTHETQRSVIQGSVSKVSDVVLPVYIYIKCLEGMSHNRACMFTNTCNKTSHYLRAGRV